VRHRIHGVEDQVNQDVPQLGLTLLLAWIEVVVALAGAFLIVNERVVRES